MNVFKKAFDSQRYSIQQWFKKNTTNISMLLTFTFPMITFFVGIWLEKQTTVLFSDLIYLSAIFITISVLFWLFVSFLNEVAMQLNDSHYMPVPEKRFTSVDDYGEVTVETERLQELLIFLSEFEDHAEKKGLL